MRRSIEVAAPLLALAASAMIAGCRKPEMQRCVDEHNVVVDDKLCQAQGVQGQQQRQSDGHGGFLPLIIPYHYYYGGYGGYGLGSVAGGGGYAPVGGRSYATSSGARSSSGTARGGFGSTHAGGGGSGE